MSDALREMESQVGVLSKAVVKAKAEYDNKVHAIEEEKQAQASHDTQIEEVQCLVLLCCAVLCLCVCVCVCVCALRRTLAFLFHP